MTTPFVPFAPVVRSAALVLVCGAAVVGCQTPSSAPPPPSSSLQLMGAEPLSLPPSCEAAGSYFVEFTVYEDGRTGAIKTPAGSSCVSDALSAWVASFRYTPQSRPVDTGVEWLMVAAKRGS